ncbi:PRC-barrel domain-containing protein [Consotaella salsifontis]|uniref:PRC-barrel domain-containing protein n=1 Tax=Consotaella salsifontis TaxID=1365950 RepID=A0A1T4NUZ2_9HYPH|nr:PRC-barrel domain-containing protein [Consotaella salsifontis]SJZ82558.1 PRC-barrel domain-containing protein [Consotaella salsifontis]
MLRTLLATTALATVIATGAFAQDAATTPKTDQPAATAPAGNQQMQAGQTQAQAQTGGDYLQKLSPNQYLASNLSDTSLYGSNAEDADSLGDIDNFLVGKDGKVAAALINSGSALGDQSRMIAVPFEQIAWSLDDDNDVRAVYKGNIDELKQAPAFMTPEAAAATNSAATAPAAGTGAAGTGVAMAPAGDANTAATTAQNNAATTTTGAAGTGTDGQMAANNTAAGTAGTANGAADGQMASASGFATNVGADQYLTSNLIGADVRSAAGDDSDDFGEIDDLVVSSNGQVDAAVIGVGGFLGIGEKDVAVPFERVAFNRTDNNELTGVLQATKDQLKSAPEFDDDRDAAMAQNDGTMTNNATGAMTADNAAPAGSNDQMAQTAPATDQANDGQMAANAPAAGVVGTGAATAPAANSDMTASTGGDTRQNLQPVTGDQLSADNLMGTTVYGPNDDSIGSVGDIALTAKGQVDAIVVDVGGFLGIGAKPVALAMDNIQIMRDDNNTLYLYTKFTQDQLENAPEYNKDTYAQNRDTMRVQSTTTAQ